MVLQPFRLQTRDDRLGKITETLFSEVCFHGSVRDGGAKMRPSLNPSAAFVNSRLCRFPERESKTMGSIGRSPTERRQRGSQRAVRPSEDLREAVAQHWSVGKHCVQLGRIEAGHLLSPEKYFAQKW